MNAEFWVKDNREWWGLGSSDEFMTHLEREAFLQLQAGVAMHEQEPSAARLFFPLSFFSKKIWTSRRFDSISWQRVGFFVVVLCFFFPNMVQVNELLCISALFSAFFWETNMLVSFVLLWLCSP